MRDQRERDDVPPLYAMSLADARAADLASIRATGRTGAKACSVVTDHLPPDPDVGRGFFHSLGLGGVVDQGGEEPREALRGRDDARAEE